MIYKINEIADININSLSSKENIEIINYLDTGNITKGFIEDIAILEVGVDKIPSRAKRKVKTGDIIYSTVRPNQEHYGYIEKENENLIVSTGFAVVSPKYDKVNPYFLYCYLTQSEITDYLQGIAENSTTAYPSIKPQDIGNLEIELPSRRIQDFIANIFKNISEKMLLNKQLNNNLEELANTLFNRWFINFEYPNEQGLPYQSSGGEMVESELGEIPENWEVVQVKDICEANIKSLSKKDNWTELNYLDTGNITGNSIDTIQFINLNEEKAPSRAKRLVEPNDIVFSTVRPNQKHYGIIKESVHNMVVSTGFAVLSTNTEYSSELLYLYLTQQNMMDNFQAIAEQSTSAYPAIKAEDILKQKILRPTNEVLADISRILSSNFNCIWELQQENKRLAQLRDTLLPKLLSGEIEIRDESVVDRA